MIATLEPLTAPGEARRPRGRLVIELVGPAAVGKTSVVEALGAEGRLRRTGMRVPRYRHLTTALALAPTFLALHRPYRGMLWKEMKRITYLGSLLRLLRERSAWAAGSVVLDEGAVYMLARLEVLGGERTRSTGYARWRRAAIEAWAQTLDLIVWLDAPDAVLSARLRERAQEHPVKRLPDDAVQRFLADYRRSYRRLIQAFETARGPEVLTVRSDREGPRCIARRLSAVVRTMEGISS